MNLDFRWIAISCAELVVAVAFLAFVGNSWSSSESSWVLIGLFLVFMVLNEGIARLFLRVERRRRLRH